MKRANKLSTNIKLMFLSAALLVMVNSANANNERLEQLKLVGQGDMSWMFISLYQASFYSQTGKYQQQVYPQALKITYQKNIDKDDLVTATHNEWKKLSLDANQYKYWLTALTQIWPDIKNGDDLLFIVEGDGNGVFYHNNKRLGGIDSTAFSAAFLSIWLSENSSEPRLRKQLIGE